MKSFVSVVFLAAAAAAVGPPYAPAYPDAHPAYTFNYDVYNSGDGYEHQAFRQQEDRDGYETHGEYSVQLADGRVQRVVYQVVGDSGFIADVSYEGTAKPYSPPAYKKPYVPPPPPPPKPYRPPTPAYRPAAPVYLPKPVVVPAYAPAKPYRPPPPPPPPKPVVPAYAPPPPPPPAPKRQYGPVRFNPFG